MTEFIGNCNDIIDWQGVVDTIKDQEPGYIGPRHRKGDAVTGIDDIADMWKEAGYVIAADGGNAGWGMYFAGKHFDQTVVDTFCNYVNITPINAWISKIDPGMVAPWHWDANDNEEEYSQMDLERYSVCICKPKPGHVFAVDDVVMYNQAQGDTFKWTSRKSWHGGANCGLTPKYLFNIFGERNGS